MMKAAPPLRPVSMGKRQMLPNPTAEPAAANTAPNLLPKFSLFVIMFLVSFHAKLNTPNWFRNIKKMARGVM